TAANMATVTIVDSPQPTLPLIFASQIILDDNGTGSNYSFVGNTSADELQLPAAGTVVEVNQIGASPTTATISASIVNVGGGALQTSGDGNLTLDGSASIGTIT